MESNRLPLGSTQRSWGHVTIAGLCGRLGRGVQGVGGGGAGGGGGVVRG